MHSRWISGKAAIWARLDEEQISDEVNGLLKPWLGMFERIYQSSDWATPDVNNCAS